MTKDAPPRYQVVADALVTDIAKGRCPVGSTLPTKHELCELFGISRFTVCEALRRPRGASLVISKPRAGTTVIAMHRPMPYTQSLESRGDLLRYVANTKMRIGQVHVVDIDATTDSDLGIPSGEAWLFALAIRFHKDDHLSICLIRLFIDPAFSRISERLKDHTGAIYRMIERHYNVVVARVKQRILTVPLSSSDASRLNVKASDLVLRIVRLYYDSGGRLWEASDSIHPATRFSYTIGLRRVE